MGFEVESMPAPTKDVLRLVRAASSEHTSQPRLITYLELIQD